jgi:poly(3-hydroxybutyrate) depolymerase
MSYELIVKKPEIFKAAASILGTMSLETSNNRSLAQATPILQLSGKLDQIVPVNGLMGLYGGWGGAPKILDNMEYWAELNKYDVKEFLQ